MIKKLIVSLGFVLAPLLAMAAFNDVSLGTSAIISIDDSLGSAVSLTVSGSADVVESIVVGSTSFTVTLQSGSTLTVASAGRNSFTTGANSLNYSTTCETSQSTITLTATTEITVSVSVSPNACGAVGSSSSSSGSNGPVAQSGGGGGGSSITVSIPTPSTSSLESQVATLQAQVDTLKAKSGSGAGFTFSKSLNSGVRHTDVMNLQKVLNSDFDTQVSLSGAGSKGKETNYFGPATKKAVQKFQVKYGIANLGQPGFGTFGPKTRAKAFEIAKMKGL